MYPRGALVSFFCPPFCQASALRYPIRIVSTLLFFFAILNGLSWAQSSKDSPYAEQLIQQALEKQGL